MKRAHYLLLIFIYLLNSVSVQAQEQPSQEKEESILDWLWDMVMGTSDDGRNWEGSDFQLVNNDIYDDVKLKSPIAGSWKFNIGDNLKWKEKEYNDKSWSSINAPQDWELQGYNGYDGYAWYRYHFDGSRLSPKDFNYLMLGFIDDVDETYINGQLIGKSGVLPPKFRTAYNALRKYIIPNELINFEGDNVIAVRVYDDYKNGGICGGAIGFYTAIDYNQFSLLQNLAGLWKFNDYNSSSFSAADMDDSGWGSIIVPAYWDNHGYRTFDGTAWYRKHFKLNFTLNPNEDYYLVLGKIDDFDETYLNGQKIGQTNDGRRLGESNSFQEIRLYKIPDRLLNQNSDNVIAVKVKDIGIEGGMYSGIIGIVEASDLAAVLKASK